ncbi:MAG: universal stress protein [Pseudomonadales bacterium]|nr:universal stress protein [Pseudomonadales bacterium]
MKAVKNILVIADKPKHEQRALHRALDLQKQTGANLNIKAFVFDSHVANGNAFAGKQRSKIKHELIAKHNEWLNSLLKDIDTCGEVTKEVIWVSDIAKWVARHVSDSPQNLVVKSVNHTESLTHTPLDWDILRTCSAPVLLCTDIAQKTKPRVLAAIDMSRHKGKRKKLNKKVLNMAAYFANTKNAELHCVYTVEISQVLKDLDMINPKSHARVVREQIMPELEEFLAPYGVPADRIHMPVGKVGKTVSKIASQIRAELLVLGTSRRSGVGALVVGNSAEKVLRKSHCEVLAIKL